MRTPKTNTLAKSKKYPQKRLKLSVVLMVAVLAGGVLSWVLLSHNNRHSAKASQTQTKATDGVNLSPPTPAQKQQGEAVKTDGTPDANPKGNSTGTPPPPTTTGGLKQVSPVLLGATAANSGSGNGTVRGMVNGVVEDGGTCTFTFTLGSQHFSKQSTAFANAQNTNCTPLTVPCTDFGAPCTGSTTAHTWSVVLTYSSSTATGTSAPGAIEVYN